MDSESSTLILLYATFDDLYINYTILLQVARVEDARAAGIHFFRNVPGALYNIFIYIYTYIPMTSAAVHRHIYIYIYKYYIFTFVPRITYIEQAYTLTLIITDNISYNSLYQRLAYASLAIIRLASRIEE